MKIAKIITLSIVAMFSLLSITLLTKPAYAQPTCTDNSPSCGGPSGNPTSTNQCDKVNSSGQLTKCVQSNPIVKDLQLIINFLSAGVGLVVIIMIIVGGIQYSMAGDNAQAITAAKQRITNALIALVAFIFIFAFLQWLIPGGLFG